MKSTLTVFCLLLLSVFVLHASEGAVTPLKNPALNPVRVLEADPHPPLTLVKDGELQFAVYFDPKAPEAPRYRRAAEVLREAFWRCTGKIPALLSTAEEVASNREKKMIFLGDSEYARTEGINMKQIPVQGFELKTFPGGVVIAGKSTGTVFGVYDFIERYLGCRFFMPTEIGSVWPACRDLSISPARYRDEPYVINREQGWFIATAFGYDNKVRWEKYFGKDYQKPIAGLPEEIGKAIPEPNRMHEVFRTGTALRYRAVHNPHAPMLIKAFPDKVREFFYKAPNGTLYAPAEVGGNGIPLMDITNLELADAIVEEWVQLLQNGKSKLWGNRQTRETNADFVTFGQCDAEIPITDLRDHSVFKEVGSSYPNLYARFHKHLAQKLKEKLPGTRLSLMAYASYSTPPTLERYRNWPDNVELQICTGDIPGIIRNPKVREGWQKRIQAWEEVLGHPVGSAWFYGIPNNVFARAVAPEYTAEAIRSLGFGRTEVFYDFYGHFEWCYYFSAYTMYRGLWNPNFNAKAAIDEHWNLFYGPEAGPLLKEFHDELIRCFEQYVVATENRDALYPLESLEKIQKLLHEAEKKLAPDSVEMKRFRVLAEPWDKAIYGQMARIRFQRPDYPVAKVGDGEMTIDGKLSEKVWSSTPDMPVFHPNGYPIEEDPRLSMKMLYGKKGLYLAFRMGYAPVIKTEGDIWKNDTVEVFLAPGKEITRYHQYAVDTRNEQWFGSRTVAPIGTPYMKQVADFQSAVFVGKDFWSLEMFIPYESLKVDPPSAGDVWHGNFVRSRITSLPNQYHGSTMSIGNNHNYTQFGTLTFR